MRGKKTHLYVDSQERTLLLHSLVELRNQLIQQGIYTDCVDELIFKVVYAPLKRMKIESIFSESETDFDLIASEVKISSQKLEKSGISQSDVIDYLTDWIRNKTNLGTDSRPACNVVVAFFIQNCEVFHKDEVSK